METRMACLWDALVVASRMSINCQSTGALVRLAIRNRNLLESFDGCHGKGWSDLRWLNSMRRHLQTFVMFFVIWISKKELMRAFNLEALEVRIKTTSCHSITINSQFTVSDKQINRRSEATGGPARDLPKRINLCSPPVITARDGWKINKFRRRLPSI